MELAETDIVTGDLYDGASGGPAGSWPIEVSTLDETQKTEIRNIIKALITGKVTYNEKFGGDVGCIVSVNDNPVFMTVTFEPIPDQFLELQTLSRKQMADKNLGHLYATKTPFSDKLRRALVLRSTNRKPGPGSN
jgi:hypothetical protein